MSLSREQQSRLVRLFAEQQRRWPRLLPGVARIPGSDGHLLLSEFSCPLLRRYNGFELALFDARSAVYYRMPGAGAGGSGRVGDGHHALRIDHWNLPGSLYLQLDKAPSGRLRVSAISASAAARIQYRLVAGHHVHPATLSFELEERIYRCLTWHLLSTEAIHEHMPSIITSLDPETLRGWLDECGALGPRLSGIAAECRTRLTPAATPDPGAPTRSPL